MSSITLSVVGAGETTVDIRHVLNGGYAGRDTAAVQHHIDELARLGVPAPSTAPTMYPLAAMLATQTTVVDAPHDKTSGEAEWALIVPEDADSPEDYLLAAACDHTDRALEVHGVAWSKQSAPNIIGDLAWRWGDVREDFDQFSLKAWVTSEERGKQLLQSGTAGDLLSPAYWIERLGDAGLLRPCTLLMSGTIGMVEDVSQFAPEWLVELSDGKGNTSRVNYSLNRLSDPWE